MGGWITERWWTVSLSLFLVVPLLWPGWSKNGIAVAGQQDGVSALQRKMEEAASGKSAEYQTPLAGEPLRMVFMGRQVSIPARDRGHVTALTLGGEFYSPKQSDSFGTPVFALYLKRMWETSRTRSVIGIFANDLEYDKSFGDLELVARFENNTVPFGQREVVNNREIKSSNVRWGTVMASLGPGLRYRVSPFQVDNDLRLQLLGKAGYFYAGRTSDTAPNLVLPPDTILYGLKLRGRYDGMRRNLLELPHAGMAAGFDLDYLHRERWADFGTRPDALISRANTQNYLQFNGYLAAASGIPGLSEKNRMLFSFHGGIAPRKSADRYNAVTISGGPLSGETEDLSRPNYPGAAFNEIFVADYALAALEYRRELAPFLYLHLRETLIWAERATVTAANRFLFRHASGAASTIGLDTGFFWDSELYLAYSWDTGFIRGNRSGSGLILVWNRSF